VAIISFPAILARKEGGSDFIISLVISAPAIGQLSTILWAHYTQQFPKMKVMVFLGSAARLSLALVFFAFQPWLFAVIMMICLTLELSISPAYAGIMQGVYPDSQRGIYMGMVRVISSIATVICAFLLGVILENSSFREVYPFVALLGFGSILVFSRIHYKEVKSTRPPITLKAIIMLPGRDKKYGLFLRTVFIMGFFNLLAAAVYPLIMVDDLHVSNSFVGIMNALQSLVAILSYYFWGRFIDRHHPALILYITFILGALVIFIYMVAWNYLLLLPVALLTGIITAGADLANINNAIRFAEDKQDVPQYIALYSSLVGVRGVIAPFLATFLLFFMNARMVLLIAFIGITLGCINFYRVRKKLLDSTE
jgi:MFS family permease